MDKKLDNKSKIKRIIGANSVPILFIVLCILGIYYSDLSISYVTNEIITRIGRNLLLVLSLIIPVIAGMGLNFAIVLGAMAGQIGLIIIKILDIGAFPGFLLACVLATPFAILFGYLTGKVLNKTKGREMITTMILGFFAMGLWQLVFLNFIGSIIPVNNPEIILKRGFGLKNAIDLKFVQYSIDRIWELNIMGIKLPVVTLAVVAIFAVATKYIVKTKLGQDFRALGQDLNIAKVAGVNTDKKRITAMIISIVLAAYGQIIFLQNLGTLNTYASHEQVGMFSIAALLIGGATVTKATIGEAFVGVILFHTLFIVSPQAGNNLFGDAQIGEFFRVFISYGVIGLSLVLHSMQKRHKQ